MNDPKRYLLEGIKVLQSEKETKSVPLWYKIMDGIMGVFIFVGWWSFVIYLFTK